MLIIQVMVFYTSQLFKSPEEACPQTLQKAQAYDALQLSLTPAQIGTASLALTSHVHTTLYFG